MNIQESMEYITKLNKRGSVLGLENIQSLLAHLGQPQNRIPVIHVAGTNGKGSTIAFMEGILRAAGYRVGKYISPTVFSYLERFQVDGRNLSEEAFARLVSQIAPIVEKMEVEENRFPTAFEVETAVAFFACQDMDCMLLETGMGGRLDSTNVVEKPLCTVLASISMDHMEFLGDTLEQIAAEKAGILRTGVTCVSNPANVRVEHTLKQCCEKVSTTYMTAKSGDWNIESSSVDGTRFTYKGQSYEIGLVGEHQVENAVTAIMAVEAATQTGKLHVTAAHYVEGLKTATWPARLEKIGIAPDIYMDGAHNIDACLRLRQAVETYFGNRDMIYIVGVLKDKAYEKMMNIMLPGANAIYTVTPSNHRGLDAKQLKAVCDRYCDLVECCDSLKDALASAKARWSDLERNRTDKEKDKPLPPVILAFGSLSYIGELKYEQSR